MEMMRLSLATLVEADRKVPLAFDGSILRAARDCDDRPFDPAPRVVTLTAKITPVTLQDGTYDGCTVQLFVVDKMPERRSAPLKMRSDRSGLLFDADNLKDNHPTLEYGRDSDS